ncbi:MAG: sel1 repeat family protein [Parvibaculaceae bacterium]|nr:sel1 repeat family protein [Parvibaculaceae bacterium]
MKHLIAALFFGIACITSSPIYASDASSEFSQAKKAYNEKRYGEAFALFQKAANADHPAAQLWLGTMYRAGNGVKQSLPMAIEWTEKAGENGDTQAQMGLAAYYSQGPENERNGKKVFYWLTKAVQAYHPEALFRVGQAYARDEKAPANIRGKGADMIITSARMGFAQAQFGAAELFAVGAGVPRDLERAMMWFHIAEKNGLKESVQARDFYLQKFGFQAGALPFSGRSLSAAKACWNTDYEYNCGDLGQLPPKEVKRKYAEFLAKRYQEKKQGALLGPKEIWK